MATGDDDDDDDDDDEDVMMVRSTFSITLLSVDRVRQHHPSTLVGLRPQNDAPLMIVVMTITLTMAIAVAAMIMTMMMS